VVLRVVLRVERLEYELIRNDSERRLESPGTNVTRTSSHGVRPSTANTLADAGALTCASSSLRAHRPIRAGGLATRSARDVPHFDDLGPSTACALEVGEAPSGVVGGLPEPARAT